MITKLLKGFLQRDGISIFYATMGGRLLSFFASWIALKLIPNYELGFVIYAQNLVAFLIPISGFGATQGLLRFGALAKTDNDRKKLFTYVLYKGLIFSAIIIFSIVLLGTLFIDYLETTKGILTAIAFQILTLFLLESLKTYYRIVHQNKMYARIEIAYNVLLVILVFAGSYFFLEKGYVFALVTSPLLIFLAFYKKPGFRLVKKLPVHISLRFFWRYSFYAGLSNVASQLLIVLDTLLIGSILNDPEKVTLYKYLALIPFSLLFLSRVLLMTDFVTLTQKYKDKAYLIDYIKNYIFFFTGFSVIILLLGWVFRQPVLQLFGSEFIPYSAVFGTLLIGISSILILRGLFGNLLSVIGKAHANFWISVLGIGINLISNFILIPQYGILGAAITSAAIMWITSLASAGLFYFYYRAI